MLNVPSIVKNCKKSHPKRYSDVVENFSFLPNILQAKTYHRYSVSFAQHTEPFGISIVTLLALVGLLSAKKAKIYSRIALYRCWTAKPISAVFYFLAKKL